MQRLRRFEREQHQIAKLAFGVGAVVFRAAVFFAPAKLFANAHHAFANLLQLLHHRLNALRADRKLFDQRHAFATTKDEIAKGFLFLFLRRLAGHHPAEIDLVGFDEPIERRQVLRHAAENLILFEVLRDRNLDRAVERQVLRGGPGGGRSPPGEARNRIRALCGGIAGG